jgi:AraC-like DNA-binding protein
MFFVAGIGIAVFIEFLLISKKNKSASDQVLTVWMFVILVHLFLAYLFFTEDIYSVPFLLGLEHPLPLVHGVFLYLYTCHVTDQLPRNRKTLPLHFVPAALVYLYLIPFFILPADQKIEVYRNRGAGYELFMAIKGYAIVLSGISYVVWSALLLKKHRINIRDQFSDLHKINLQWLQILAIGLGGIWFLVIFFQSEMLILAGMVVFVFLIGFFGVRQAAIFTSIPVPVGEARVPLDEAQTGPVEATRVPGEETRVLVEESEQKKKYPKSGLTEEVSRKLHQALMQLMAGDALYRKPDLSITDLSARLGVHPNYLSQVINQEEKKNFYDFVNTYRIEEFMKLIGAQKNQQFTLLSLAYDCGFSSKSSFNRYFKKVTGKTPSEYAATLNGNQIRPE